MADPAPTARWRGRFEWRIAALAWGLGAIACVLGAAVVWRLPADWVLRGMLMLLLLSVVTLLVTALHRSVTRPLRGLANVVEAYRGGDYTLRSRRRPADDALGELVHEINSLGDTLHGQRLRAMEATALLDKLIASIDVAVLAFDGERQLRLLNPAASRLLGAGVEAVAGQSAASLGLEELLSGEIQTRIETSIAGRTGRWQVTHGTFRESGLAQHLLIVSDVQRVLREEERAAWQRLIRVIGHEVNNSLTPIKSMAETLHDMLSGALPGGKTREDALDALRTIGERTTSLGRFLAQYGRLARLPVPRPRWQPLAPLLTRLAVLAPSHRIEVRVADDLEAYLDADQFEQALINLTRNAVEAQSEEGRVTIAAGARAGDLILTVTDEGLGIANPDNLFVPFFTTKPGGSGVGLILSRQIAEAHGGTLRLENRADTHGAVATLEFPRAARHAAPPHASLCSSS